MLGADTKINLNPIERIIGEHDLDKLIGGAAARKCRCSPLFVYVGCRDEQDQGTCVLYESEQWG